MLEPVRIQSKAEAVFKDLESILKESPEGTKFYDPQGNPIISFACEGQELLSLRYRDNADSKEKQRIIHCSQIEIILQN